MSRHVDDMLYATILILCQYCCGS